MIHRTPRFLSAALALALAFGCMGGDDAEALDDALIRPVERGDLIDEVAESGKIAPAFEVDIKAKVSGEVSAVHVQEGQVVKGGEVLLDVADSEYRRQVEMARVQVQEATIQLENAESQERRNAAALASRGISEIEYTLAVQQRDLARVGLKRARLNFAAAEEQLSYTHVTSPIDGTVIRRSIEVGEVVTAGMTAMVNGEAQLTIAQMDRLLLDIDLNQVDVARVAVGQAARILLDAYPGKEITGTVTQIAAAGHLDTTRGIDVFTVRVEVDPSTADVRIKPGMTAEVRVKVGEWPGVVKVPVETVFEADGKSWLYVVKDVDGETVKEKVEVTVGHRSDREVEITGGLGEGDRIYAQADVKDMGARFE
ncbi:MAG: efflux RND transporter periplasmic adaptor subunit [Deltaproteobacteria bacterium]|nr:efflux RND transporter periplasmic adaptor subunit [Deltaproteobacteria bacterium]